MVPEVGIAPTSPPLQGGANLFQLLRELASALRAQGLGKNGLPTVAAGEGWSSRAVMLRGLPLIRRVLYF